MKTLLKMFPVACALLYAPLAHASLQPGVLYDARSAGLAGTGAAYLDSGAASFHNPALMSKVAHSATTLTISPFITDITAPVPQLNPGTGNVTLAEQATGYALSPLLQLGTAYRVHDRVVIGANALVVAGASLSFNNVPIPTQTASAQLIQAELQIPIAFQLLDDLSVGIAYRITYGTVSEQLFTALTSTPALLKISGTAMNFAGIQAGLHYKPCTEFELGVNYRNQVSLNWSGTTTYGGTNIPDLSAKEAAYQAPHAFSVGVATHLLEDQLMIVAEYDELLYSQVSAVLDQGWKDAWSAKLGVEYKITSEMPLRLGASYGEQATSDAKANFLGVPPGHPTTVSVGTGYTFGEWVADVALNYAWYSHTVPVDTNIASQTPGNYKLSSIEIFLAGTYKF